MRADRLTLDAQVDFPDDAGSGLYSRDTVRDLMRRLREMGTNRVYWNYYGTAEEERYLWNAAQMQRRCFVDATLREIGNPIDVAVACAHAEGMELFAVVKPHEHGMSNVLYEGAAGAAEHGRVRCLGGWLHNVSPFVAEHPDLRMERAAWDPWIEASSQPVSELWLTKSDAEPTRVNERNIEILAGERNGRFTPVEGGWTLEQRVVALDAEMRDGRGCVHAPRGKPVRMLVVRGFSLRSPYVAVRVVCGEGPSDFGSTGGMMLRLRDGDGRPIRTSVGTPVGAFGSRSDLEGGVAFDAGGATMYYHLDHPGTFIAAVRGANRYLPGALCAGYPRVAAFWLRQVSECLAAGADGIDFRIENHSCGVDDPAAYGFNDVLVDACARRMGLRARDRVPAAEVAREHGRCYDDFLWQARGLVQAAGKRMAHHVNVEYLRPDPPAHRIGAYPWNIRHNWREWILSGLLDEVTLRTYQFYPSFVLRDAFAGEVMALAKWKGLPVNYVRYIHAHHDPHRMQKPAEYIEELREIAADGRLDRVTVYETANLFRSDGAGGLTPTGDWVEAIHRQALHWR